METFTMWVGIVSCIMSIAIGITMGCVIAVATFADHRRPVKASNGADAVAREEVVVGDVWEHVGDYRPGLLYAVMCPNFDTYADPDSWAMRQVRLIDGRWEVAGGAVKCMHHSNRVRGDWVWRAAAVVPYSPMATSGIG